MEKVRVRKEQGGEVRPEIARAYGVSVNSPAKDDALSPNEIAKILNVTGEAVKQWIYHRQLPGVKLRNGYWRVRKSDLERFLQARLAVGRMRVLLALGTKELPAVVEAVEAAGHIALSAKVLADALLKLIDVRPNLIMIDLLWKDCWKLAKTVRDTKGTRHIGIVFLSTREPRDNDLERMTELSALGCIQLPVSKEVLVEEINRNLFRVR